MAAQNHKDKIALITGANKGIGYELTRQLGEEGVTVLMAARSAKLGEAAAGSKNKSGRRRRTLHRARRHQARDNREGSPDHPDAIRPARHSREQRGNCRQG